MSKILIFPLVFFSLLVPALAQNGALPSTNGPPAGVKPVELRVTQVSPHTNRLGGQITLTVTDAAALETLANQKSKKLALFINGNELSDVQPSGKDLGANTLSFQLQRTAVNKAVWIPLLRNPMGEPLRPLLISVGVQGEAPLLVESSARNTYLWVIGWNWWTESWLAVLGVLFLLFILLAIYSDILKTPETDAEGRHLYSLSRTQAAFWLFITAFSFVFIWVVTCDVTTLNGSVLALIGISAGTYVAATILERRPSDSPTTAATVETKADPGNVVGKVVNEVQKLRLIDLFLKDILSDEKGISVPRFQIFAWTIILGIIFLVSVINELSMPEFNGTLLALMGISSATYVGAKMNQ